MSALLRVAGVALLTRCSDRRFKWRGLRADRQPASRLRAVPARQLPGAVPRSGRRLDTERSSRGCSSAAAVALIGVTLSAAPRFSGPCTEGGVATMLLTMNRTPSNHELNPTVTPLACASVAPAG